MTLWVGDAFRKQFEFVNIDISDWGAARAELRLSFYNGDRASFTVIEIINNIAQFVIPAATFTEVRSGPCEYQVRLYDDTDVDGDDDASSLHSDIFEDEVRVPLERAT